MILLLIFEKQYRNLFYFRVGNSKYFFKWLLQEDRSLRIPVRMTIGKYARFVHNQSTFLNAKSIGDYFVCYHNVTIGTASLDSDNKPEIGHNVTIFTGAVVVGEITIGDNVKIGANSVIVKNVPANCTVIGSPARIIRLNGQRVDIPL
ncbi:MAG: serine acetyltransferase [Flavobacterium sp.]|nr:MAG: serine acetyltransferase [Flavobacterium sp.]